LQEVGEIMHLAGSGRVIVQLSKELVEGQILCDEKGTRVAKVIKKTICFSNAVNK